MPNWNEVFNEIQAMQLQGANAQTVVRKKYLNDLHQHTKRNLIAYYSGWLSKGGVFLSDINDEDKNGFMTTIHKLDRTLGLDLILHTPGGGIAATQSIVTYLQKMFGNNIRAFVPQISMSAGTIIACCCKEIWMGKQSNLGPIDPQLAGIPAHGVVQEFKRAVREIKKDPAKIVLWQQIIGQYRPTFLGQCENAIRWSNTFVEQQLKTGMLQTALNSPTKAVYICADQPATCIFRLRNGGGPYIYSAAKHRSRGVLWSIFAPALIPRRHAIARIFDAQMLHCPFNSPQKRYNIRESA
jgi:ATP-dependent protease ClpP protease subunit